MSPKRYDSWGDGVQIDPGSIAQPTPRVWKDFRLGYVSADSPEDVPEGAYSFGRDVEVSRSDRLVRAPGIKLAETLTRGVDSMFLHADLNGLSELVMIRGAKIGAKSSGVTIWGADILPASAKDYEAANYAGVLLFSNGLDGLWRRNPVSVPTLIAGAPSGRTVSVFAGRVLLGGTDFSGTFEPMGRAWSDATIDPEGWDVLNGAGYEVMISSQQLGDYCVADRVLGLDLLVILNRRSIWIGTATGQVDRPVDYRPRIEGVGCVSAKTAHSTRRGVIFLSDQGVCLFNGEGAEVISHQINAELLPLVEGQETQYTAGYNPTTERYYLHTPYETWIYDLTRQRWARWSLRASLSVVFPTQKTSPSWDDEIGDWDSAIGSWDATGNSESGALMYFVDGYNLGVEDAATFGTLAGQTYNPKVELGSATADDITQQFTTTAVQMVCEGTGDSLMDLSLVDRKGKYEVVKTGVVTSEESVQVPLIHTGRGVGLGIRWTSGNVALRRAGVLVLPNGFRGEL